MTKPQPVQPALTSCKRCTRAERGTKERGWTPKLLTHVRQQNRASSPSSATSAPIMGFPTQNILSAEGHFSEFVCAVCMQLVDPGGEVLLTACHHVFCGVCLRKWLDSKPSCPTCKRDLGSREVGELKTSSPLGWRVLSRIRVQCPLHVSAKCDWQGEYSEVQSHLTSDAAHVGNSKTSARVQAIALKEQANEKFRSASFREAILLYSKALKMFDQEATIFSNRAAAFLHTRAFDACVADCERAVALKPELFKAYVRGSKALIELGRVDAAVELLERGRVAAVKDGTTNDHVRDLNKHFVEAIQYQEALTAGRAALEEGRHAAARAAFAQLLTKSAAPEFMLCAARAELRLGFPDRALRLTLQVLRANKADSSALALRGYAMALNDEGANGAELVKQALRLSPDDHEAKLLWKAMRRLSKAAGEARKAAGQARHEEAIEIFNTILDCDDLSNSSGDAPRKRSRRSDVQNEPLIQEVDPSNSAQRMEDERDKHSMPNVMLLPPHAPIRATLHAERANSLYRLKRYDDALRDCAIAIYAREDCKRAWLTKSYCLHAMGRHQEVLDEFTPLMERWGQSDEHIKGAFERAQFEVRKHRRVDYYALLSGTDAGEETEAPSSTKLTSLSSELEIKAAYKRVAMLHHPDKVKDKDDKEAIEAAEAKFKLLGEALEILTDSFKRQLYDEGFDKEAIEERVARAQRAAHSNDSHGGGGHHHRHH